MLQTFEINLKRLNWCRGDKNLSCDHNTIGLLDQKIQKKSLYTL